MPRPSPAPLSFRLGRDLLACASALASALWIAISAAAPEFIWRGFHITIAHFDRTTLIAALLIGLFLAFFVEPAIERLRGFLHGAGPHHRTARSRSALFVALVGLAFAFASVCLHAAMTAYLSEHAGEHPPTRAGLNVAINLTIAWASVPFAVTLAWLARGQTWRAVPLGIAAAASTAITGWLFHWTTRSIVATIVPCLFIQFLGYRAVAREPQERAFIRCAGSLARIAVSWLAFALLLDAVFSVLGLDRLALYNSSGFWMDVRFYIGWALGLLFAPFPERTGIEL